MLERLVARLVADEILHRHLVFKGGFVGLRVYDSLRYTVDVDALVVKANVESTLERTREKAESDLEDGVGSALKIRSILQLKASMAAFGRFTVPESAKF